MREIYHRIHAMLLGYGFGSCPRCGRLFSYGLSRGVKWDATWQKGWLTCCRDPDGSENWKPGEVT